MIEMRFSSLRFIIYFPRVSTKCIQCFCIWEITLRLEIIGQDIHLQSVTLQCTYYTDTEEKHPNIFLYFRKFNMCRVATVLEGRSTFLFLITLQNTPHSPLPRSPAQLHHFHPYREVSELLSWLQQMNGQTSPGMLTGGEEEKGESERRWETGWY